MTPVRIRPTPPQPHGTPPRRPPADEDRADTDTPEFPPVAGAAPGNDMNFHGRHIFVIGGSRGIGASCVEMLARRGAVSPSTQRRGPRAHPPATVVCRPSASHTLPTAARPSNWRCAPAARLRGPALDLRGSERPPCPSSDAELGEGGGGRDRRRVSGRRGQPGGDGKCDGGGGGAANFPCFSAQQRLSKSVGAPQVAAVGLPLDGLVCSAGVFEATPVAEWNTPYQGHEGTE